MIALLSLLKPIPDARHSLILKYMPHVQSYVRCRFRNLDSEGRRDLMAAALLGLVDAARRYDEKMQNDFWSYARRRVQGAVSDHLRLQDPLTRTQRRKVRQAAHGSREDEGRISPPDALPEESEVRRMRECRVLNFSLLDREDEDPFQDRLADDAHGPEELAHHRLLLDRVFGWIDELPARERQVLDGIYRKRQSAREVARSLDLTEGRISQLHQHGIDLLRERWLSSSN